MNDMDTDTDAGSDTCLALARPGDTLPEIHFGRISRATLTLYAGASGDHNLVHIDTDFAREAGLNDVFAQGMLSLGVLARVASSWGGADRIRRLSGRFMAITPVNADLTCSGEVAERLEIDGQPHVRVNLVAEIIAPDASRTRTIAGEAIIRTN
ncbi:MaoC/PaaZ C-terminal domain-containing protein [Paracoccus marinus]|uniref:MaoC/PaaZ C-terminal domain-containing protein n=1 Tax=Paracoccus marinus TaxID=288426 RepID=UPI001C8F4042|nr:MaoC/PaaZ C-terminal domain-containing protein [Paracoccus marinus]GLS79606.1 MaoC family dehydratase [Paracoccus marinus]